MTRRRFFDSFGYALLGGAAFAAWLAGCSTGDAASTSSSDPTATTNAATIDASGATATGTGSTGLPCDVDQLLVTHCQACHSAHPSAPMPLVTWDDLHAPARSDPTKPVFELAVTRITSPTSFMPPTGPLGADDIATFTAWADAGAPKGTCSSDASGDAGAAECTIASDCPGVLVCRRGVCDVECVNDKDCTATWTCENTRCTPPAASDSPTYDDLTTTSAWSTTSLTGAAATYSGTVFDGRYVYFAPDAGSGVALRYDTKSGFTSTRAWATIDLTTLAAAAKSYRGAAFDGRYVYLVPSGAGATLARYDTQAPYLAGSSWTFLDLTAVSPAAGFLGATFDGRYLYLAPTDSAIALRYDTAGAMTDHVSWSTFKISSVDSKATSFAGVVAAGRYVYYVPNGGSAGPRGVIARYDAEAAFVSASSWTTLDLTGLHASAAGYRTGAFDGRYLYLVPGWTAPTPSWSMSTIARYDTQATFAAPASWTFFDTTGVAAGAAGFNAAAFDGRRLILAPGYDGAYHGLTLAFDTEADMTKTASWSVFDMTTLGAVRNLRGASFDGRYVYYTPESGIAARFDARPFAAGAALPEAGGSFY